MTFLRIGIRSSLLTEHDLLRKPVSTFRDRALGYITGGRGPVAQGIEQQPSKLKVAGSNPAGVANKISGFLHLRPMISALKIAWGGMGAERKWPA